MNSSDFCPIISESCHKEECVMWSGFSCILVDFLHSSHLHNQYLESLHNERQAIIEEKSQLKESKEEELEFALTRIRSGSIESLANELLDFARSQDSLPNAGDRFSYDFLDLFWEYEGLPRFGLPHDINAKKIEINMMALKLLEESVLEEINRFSDQDLAQKFLDFTKERSLGKSYYSLGESSLHFWLQYKIGHSPKNSEIVNKKQRVYDIARAKLANEKKNAEKERIILESETLPELIDKIIYWAREKGITQLINQDISVFLLEESLELHHSTQRALKFQANSQLRYKK